MIDLLFAFLNLALVVGIITYVAYTYFIPALRQQVQEEQETEQALGEEYNQLVLQKKQLDATIISQDAYIIELRNKVDLWHQVLDKQKEVEKEEQQLYLEKAKDVRRKQSHIYALRKQYEQLAPKVYDRVEKTLEAYYADPENVHAYIKQILNQMKKA